MDTIATGNINLGRNGATHEKVKTFYSKAYLLDNKIPWNRLLPIAVFRRSARVLSYVHSPPPNHGQPLACSTGLGKAWLDSTQIDFELG
jgi:hypothetical protein